MRPANPLCQLPFMPTALVRKWWIYQTKLDACGDVDR